MNSMSTNAHPDLIWFKIVDDFREACVLRKNGRHEESEDLLKRILPEKIAEWSRLPLPAGTNRRLQLETMFREEQRRVDDAFFLQRLVTHQIEEHLLPKLCFMVAEEIREAVRSDSRMPNFTPTPSQSPSRPRTQSPARPNIHFDEETKQIQPPSSSIDALSMSIMQAA